jgi:hypothetical protein
MNAADVAEGVAQIKAEAQGRGIRVGYVSIAVLDFHQNNVRGLISVLGGKDIEAGGDDFEDAFANLRKALDERALTTQHLANVLGIPVELAAA